MSSMLRTCEALFLLHGLSGLIQDEAAQWYASSTDTQVNDGIVVTFTVWISCVHSCRRRQDRLQSSSRYGVVVISFVSSRQSQLCFSSQKMVTCDTARHVYA